MGIGALGMYFMFELCKKMLADVVSALTKVNEVMEKFVIEQHAEHKEIIATLKEMKKTLRHK